MKSQVVRTLASVLVALGVVLATAGCATHMACTAIGVVDALFLDASPWFAAHPNGRLQACFDDRCQVVDATSSEPITLEVLSAPPSGVRTLTVQSIESEHFSPTDSVPANRVQISEAIELIPQSVGSSEACRLTAWGQNARISADGTLALHGWTGHVLPPAANRPDRIRDRAD